MVKNTRGNRQKQIGFTLIELIVVLVITGVLASVGLSRFSTTGSFEARGFTEASLTSIRYAQKLAVTSGCHVRVQINTTNLEVARWPTCRPSNHSDPTTLIRHPKNTGDFSNPIPAGLAVTNTDIYFDSIGQPFTTSSDTALTSVTNITIGARQIRIEPETGFPHL